MKKCYQKKVVSVFLALLFASVSSNIAQAQVPVTDTASTTNSLKDLVNNIKTSSVVVGTMQTIQKTNAAIGSAKKTVSEYVVANKKLIEEKLDKLKRYKEQAEAYKKQYDEYKKELDENIAKAKELKDKVEDGVETAKDTIDTAKNTIDTAVDVAKDKVSGVQDKVEGAVDAAKDKVGISQEEPVSGTAAEGPSTSAGTNITGGAEASIPKTSIGTVQNPNTVIATETPVSSRKTFGNNTVSTNEGNAAVSLAPQTSEADIINTQTPETVVNTQTAVMGATETGTRNGEVSVGASKVEASAPAVLDKGTTSEEPMSVAPTGKTQLRKAFTTSSLHQSEKLMFAKVEMLNLPDGGTDSNGVVIIPKALALYCGLSSSDALEEGAVDKCLLAINKERKSAQLLSGSDAPRVYDLAMAQYAAAAMAEAYKARQDADSFEENFIDAIDFASEPQALDVYDNIVELNKALDMQMNGLLKVFSTQLAVQSLYNYGTYSFVSEEEEEAADE